MSDIVGTRDKATSRMCTFSTSLKIVVLDNVALEFAFVVFDIYSFPAILYFISL